MVHVYTKLLVKHDLETPHPNLIVQCPWTVKSFLNLCPWIHLPKISCQSACKSLIMMPTSAYEWFPKSIHISFSAFCDDIVVIDFCSQTYHDLPQGHTYTHMKFMAFKFIILIRSCAFTWTEKSIAFNFLKTSIMYILRRHWKLKLENLSSHFKTVYILPVQYSSDRYFHCFYSSKCRLMDFVICMMY